MQRPRGIKPLGLKTVTGFECRLLRPDIVEGGVERGVQNEAEVCQKQSHQCVEGPENCPIREHTVFITVSNPLIFLQVVFLGLGVRH